MKVPLASHSSTPHPLSGIPCPLRRPSVGMICFAMSSTWLTPALPGIARQGRCACGASLAACPPPAGAPGRCALRSADAGHMITEFHLNLWFHTKDFYEMIYGCSSISVYMAVYIQRKLFPIDGAGIVNCTFLTGHGKFQNQVTDYI